MMMKNRLDDRVRLFLGSEFLRHQRPEVAREALECAHAIRAGRFDAKRIRKVLWALDLSREPAAFTERAEIFKAMRGKPLVLDYEQEMKVPLLPLFYEQTIGRLRRMTGGELPDVNWRKYFSSLPDVKSLRRGAKTHSFDHSVLIGKTLPPLPSPYDAAEWSNVLGPLPDPLASLGGNWRGGKRIPLPVGAGKTDLSIRLPLHVEGCKVAVRFVEPSEIENYEFHYRKLQQSGATLPSIILRSDRFNYVVPGAPALYVFSKVILSRPDGMAVLKQLDPDLIIVDECAFPDGTVRRSRLEEYAIGREECPRIVAWT